MGHYFLDTQYNENTMMVYVCERKKDMKGRGGMIEMHNIYPWLRNSLILNEMAIKSICKLIP